MVEQLAYHTAARADGTMTAYRRCEGAGPGVVFMGGYRSDMTGTKASFLEDWARARGRAFLRFDWFAHGRSDGDFKQATVGRWKDDALFMLDGFTTGPQILVGSSMGGWIAVLAALARPDRVRALVLIAPALDFTERLKAGLDPDQMAAMQAHGTIERPSRYGDGPYPFSLALLEEGERHLLLGAPIPVSAPVRILHGTDDPDVPWEQGLAALRGLSGGDVRMTLVKDGDHRLSRLRDLDLLARTIEDVS